MIGKADEASARSRTVPEARWLISARRVFAAVVLALSVGPSPAAAATSTVATASDAEDPCDGLFATMDRPTVADSSCAVKSGKLLTELGYQNGAIKGSDTSRLMNYPQAALRYGLPDGWELRLFPPTYNMTDIRFAAGGGHVDGFGDAAFGTKYQIGTFGGFTVATDAKVTVPSGRDAFSGGGVQGNVQGIVSYNLTPKLGVLVQVGASSLTNRADNGQIARFGSFSGNLVVGYAITDRLQVFSELFGNSVSGPNTQGNLSGQVGVQFLLTKSIEVDAGIGTLLAGPQGQQARFFLVGTGLIF